MKKVKINKRIFGVLKIDADVFNEIKQYVKTYYDEHHVEIKKEYGTYGEPIELSNAYAEIIKDRDNIECVKITGQKGDSNCVIYLNNKKGLHKSTFKLKANVYEDKELVTHLFINKIEKMMTNKIFSPAENYIYAVLGSGMCLAFVFVRKYYPYSLIVLGIFFTASILTALLFGIAVSPLLKLKKNNYNWIQLKSGTEIPEEKSKEQKAMRLHNLLSVLLAIILIGVGTYIIVLG